MIQMNLIENNIKYSFFKDDADVIDFSFILDIFD
jgi:hypothetical protein